MSDSQDQPASSTASKSTGPLSEPQEEKSQEVPLAPLVIPDTPPDKDFFYRLGELAIFLLAIVGAIALAVSVAHFFRAHTFVAAYLLAYGGYRFADLLISDDRSPDPLRDTVARRVTEQGPLLLLFFAAPFERTYLWGGEPHRWIISGMALALELAGLWLALGAQIQLAFFTLPNADGTKHQVLVQRGFYSFVRHPRLAGMYLAFIAWPIAYAAPISIVVTIVVMSIAMRRLIAHEEALMLERYGDEYRKYQDATDAMFPNIW